MYIKRYVYEYLEDEYFLRGWENQRLFYQKDVYIFIYKILCVFLILK